MNDGSPIGSHGNNTAVLNFSGGVFINGSPATGNSSANNTSQTNLTISGLTLIQTNVAPANAVTPVIWLVITNSGNVYIVDRDGKNKIFIDKEELIGTQYNCIVNDKEGNFYITDEGKLKVVK